MKPAKFLLPLLLCAILTAIGTFGFTTTRVKDHWKQLFNGKDLNGWDTYIGPDLDDNGKPINGAPVGLNNDPRHVFTIVKDNDENIIRISGENWGGHIYQKGI